MIVSGLIAEDDRVRAEVRWEEAGRDTQEIFVQGQDLSADPNGFLILCFLPAWHAGERRIVIEGGGICPVL
ncbi:hypothetical protein, partial [Allomesorhizobium camelthorni]|uniref:hypothetical protein n=1 Tax=Allomesorhizobium camelthorni TaxID=475069 RepID=UPI00197D606F